MTKSPVVLEEALYELVATHRKVPSHVGHDRSKGTDTKGTVSGNSDVVLAAFEGGQAEMATCLAGDTVPKHTEARASSCPERSRGSLIR
jgi:hypothetical protein